MIFQYNKPLFHLVDIFSIHTQGIVFKLYLDFKQMQKL